MVRTKIIESRIRGLAKDLYLAGYQPGKIMLFGSYATGTATNQSDIDVAIWAKGFTGARALDIEKIAHIISKYPLIELHTFSLDEKEESDPFMDEILHTGTDYSGYLPSFQA